MDECIPLLPHTQLATTYNTTFNSTTTPFNITYEITTQSENEASSWMEDLLPTFAYTHAPAAKQAQPSLSHNVEDFLNGRLIVFICVFGVIGNILNLIVLTRKGLQKTMDRMERSAHYGLVALALSDTLCCLTVLPHAWVDKTKFAFKQRNFDLYYVIYENGIINTLIMSSTWLTVAMATSRYLAICHPLRARDIVGMTFAKVTLVVVFLVCIVLNLPRFFLNTTDTIPCQGGWSVYFINSGYLKKRPQLEYAYMCCYSVVGILVPLILLAFCNVNLIRALRHSMQMREQYKNSKTPSKDSKHHITLTLIIIVIAYFLLLLPSEIINFLKQMVLLDTSKLAYFNTGVAIVNTLQAINFSFNFVLYCVVNVHFRRTITNMLCFWCQRSKRLSRTYSSVASAGSYVTRRTTCTDFELSTY